MSKFGPFGIAHELREHVADRYRENWRELVACPAMKIGLG